MRCGIAQNAVHLLKCRLVGHRRGRSMAEVWGDPDWYREVAVFLA